MDDLWVQARPAGQGDAGTEELELPGAVRRVQLVAVREMRPDTADCHGAEGLVMCGRAGELDPLVGGAAAAVHAGVELEVHVLHVRRGDDLVQLGDGGDAHVDVGEQQQLGRVVQPAEDRDGQAGGS
jgi:hypothetical protein